MELKNNTKEVKTKEGFIMFAKEWANTLFSATLLYLSAMFILIASNFVEPAQYLAILNSIQPFVLIILSIIFTIVAYAIMSHGDKL